MRYLKQKELIFVTIIYFLISVFLMLFNSKLYNNYINPLFFLALTAFLYIKTGDKHGRFKNKTSSYFKMFIVAVIYLIVQVYMGFVLGFSRSPYSHSFIKIIENIFKLMIPIIGIEYLRSIVINKNKENKLVIVLYTILLFLLEIKYNIIINNWGNWERLFEYTCSTILPLFSCNIVATYLAIKGSYKLTLIYRGLDKLYLILSPILASKDWFVTGIVGIFFPYVIYCVFAEKTPKFRINRNKTSKYIYLFVSALCVTLIFFILGVFKYKPLAIVSNSMVPTYYKGDMVVYKKVDNDSLTNIGIDSILIYKVDGTIVTHRVTDIIVDNGNYFFKTKGDNNLEKDPWVVNGNQVIGVYIFRVKYLGYPSVWLRENLMNK